MQISTFSLGLTSYDGFSLFKRSLNAILYSHETNTNVAASFIIYSEDAFIE